MLSFQDGAQGDTHHRELITFHVNIIRDLLMRQNRDLLIEFLPQFQTWDFDWLDCPGLIRAAL